MCRTWLFAVVVLAACGSKSQFPSLCAEQVPPPESCNTACDPAPGAATACPAGYHCTADGTCDLFCTPYGGECGEGYRCTDDGNCVAGEGSGSDEPPVDADCPAVHFTAQPITPSIQLLIDRSSSMTENFSNQDPQAGNGPYKFPTIQSALVGSDGVVTQLEASVYFGATLFTTDGSTCPSLQMAPRAKNNKAAIASLIAANPPRPKNNNPGFTPTPLAINAVVADFATNPPPTNSPPVIVLATDGLPNQCGNTNSSATESVMAAANAYAHGIKLYILAVSLSGSGAQAHIQAMADAGQGKTGSDHAMPYVATSPSALAAAFQQIIAGVVSCDLTLSGKVDAEDGRSGNVVLNGSNLIYGDDWTLDADGMTLHLIGGACTTLKQSSNPTVDATFPCGAVIY